MTVVAATIRPMVATDVARAADVIRRHDFGEREQFLAWAIDQPTIRSFVAVEHDGAIVGTGVASAHGPVGWVGVIFVTPERRGSGLGSRITRTVVDELERRGCRSQVLIASPAGRPIYERLGFAEVERQVRFSADGLDDPGAPDPSIRSVAPTDVEDVLALDRAATGEDRSPVLRSLLASEETWVIRDAGDRASGYFLRPPWRGGAVIAADPADALRLLDLRRRVTPPGGHAGAGVLASNEAGRTALRAAGWIEELGSVRMVRGERPAWQPSWIYGQLNGALG
ncbi:MAG TPA: GNAT family N-acetyltransferase [Candidatus Limnocylindrales bacterium]|nr:GNAT family N-acetyltransferase [Candidatus Limnocylindrales bacterium]